MKLHHIFRDADVRKLPEGVYLYSYTDAAGSFVIGVLEHSRYASYDEWHQPESLRNLRPGEILARSPLLGPLNKTAWDLLVQATETNPTTGE